MMARILFLIGISTGGFFLSHCGTAAKVTAPLLPSQPVKPKADPRAEEALNLAKDLKLELDAMTAKLVDMDRKIQILGEELHRVSPTKLEELESRVTILSEEFRLLEKNAGNQRERPSGKGKKTASFDKMDTFHPSPDKIPSVSETESQLYKQGTDLFYAREYGKAITQFELLLKQYPKGAFADNAAFWIGESHYLMNNYAKAISSYKRVFNFQKSEKNDDGQFKIAMSFLRMGEKKQAVTEFNKLLSLYPDSEYADKAKQELKRIQ